MNEAPRCGGSTSAFSVELPAAGLCLLGEFFEQPWSRAPSRGAVATAHPPPPALARDSHQPVNCSEPERRGAGTWAASWGTWRWPAQWLREVRLPPKLQGPGERAPALLEAPTSAGTTFSSLPLLFPAIRDIPNSPALVCRGVER